MWIDCEGVWADASTPCFECYSIPLHGGSRDGERLVAHIFRFFSARKRHQQLSFPFLLPCGCTGPPVLPVVCSPSWMFETGELDTVSYCAGQGEGAIDREQKEKLNPPWRQGKSLPGIQSTTKLFWSNFGHADRPRQLFRDYKLWACSCLRTT